MSAKARPLQIEPRATPQRFGPFQIERNIPIPPAFGDSRRYLFADMEIGDSFLVPCAKELSKATQLTVAARAATFGQRKAVRDARPRFLTRQVPGGVRCWRVA